VTAKANVDRQEDASDDDADCSQNTHDGVDDRIDRQQPVNWTVSWWSAAYSRISFLSIKSNEVRQLQDLVAHRHTTR